MPARGTEGEQKRRTEKDDRRKEVGLAPVCRLLSGNTYGDQRGEGGGGGERREERNRTKRKRDARRRPRERGCRNKRNANR